MKKEQKVNSIILISLLVWMTIVLVAGCKLSGKDNILMRIRKPISLSVRWIDADTGKSLTQDIISIGQGQTRVIKHVIPDSAANCMYLCIWNSDLHITASISDKVVSELGRNVDSTFGKENGGLWQMIPLRGESTGRMLTLSIQNPGVTRFFDFNPIYYGTYNDILFGLVSRNILYTLETLFIFLVGILLLIYSFGLRKYRLMGYFHSLCLLSILAIDTGIWLLCNSDMLQFISGNPSLRYLLAYLTFYTLPILMMLFFLESPGSSEMILCYMITAYMCWIIIALGLYMLNILPLAKSVVTVHFFVICTILVITGICIKNYQKSHSRYIFWTLVSFMVLAVGAVLSIVQFYTAEAADNSSYFRIAFVIFLILMIVFNVKESIKSFSDRRAFGHYKKLACIDPVTGGNTRMFFAERIQDYPTLNRYFLHMNLLQFKVINQVLGRAVCDRFLSNIYLELEKKITDREVLCNLGNATFGMYLEAGNEEMIHKRCAEFAESVHHSIQGSKIHIIVNPQFCLTPVLNLTEKADLDEMQDHALMARNNPLAIYWQDVNCYVYNKECREQLLRDKELEDKLDRAITEHEIMVYLQPKIAVSGHDAVSAEALARWKDPEKGIIYPAEFIPVFERNGMISRIDLYIFEQVCELINRWAAEEGTSPVISVNISKAAIQNPDFFAKYIAIAERTKVSAKYLEFELTESTAYENYDMIRKILADIHQMGASCSMDDFGKSYSNINALASLEFDTVKMDKSFFDDGFPQDAKKKQLVSGTLQLLKSLDLEVVAEGIEEKEQVDSLVKLGCDCIQGFYFAQPMPVAEYEHFAKLGMKQ